MATRQKRTGIFRRKEDMLLLLYQGAVYGAFAGLFFAFPRSPLWVQVLLFPVGLLLTQKLESPLHYSIHTPVFWSKWLNRVHRLSWFIQPFPTVLYRREHFIHHRYDNTDQDETSSLNRAGDGHVSVWQYVGGGFVFSLGEIYQRTTRPERYECLVFFVLVLGFQYALFLIDPFTTLVFWLPLMWIGSSAMNALYCYLGHVPGNPNDPYLAATYFPVRTRWHRVLNWLDFHNMAFHLTHHLYPKTHWADLYRVQAGLLDEFVRRGSPKTLAFNSSILLNPFMLPIMVWRVHWAGRKLLTSPPDEESPAIDENDGKNQRWLTSLRPQPALQGSGHLG